MISTTPGTTARPGNSALTGNASSTGATTILGTTVPITHTSRASLAPGTPLSLTPAPPQVSLGVSPSVASVVQWVLLAPKDLRVNRDPRAFRVCKA